MGHRKYFIYVRISNTDYEKSLDEQENICKGLAEQKGIKNYEIINETKSGKNSNNRPAFDKMIDILSKDAEKPNNARKYGGIVFYKIDRLARNYEDFEKLDKLFIGGYNFFSCTETIENTPTGRLFFRILSSFAIYESEKLSTRMIVSYIHRLAEKNFCDLGGDSAIFGYQRILIDAKNEKGGHKLIKDNSNNSIAPHIITKIYNLYLSLDDNGSYIDRIIDSLSKEEKLIILKNTKVSIRRKVSDILENNNSLRYNGYVQYEVRMQDELVRNTVEYISKRNNDHFEIKGDFKTLEQVEFIFYVPDLQIVSDTTYNKVRDKLEQNKLKRNYRDTTYYNGLFEGMIFCDTGNQVANPYVGGKGHYNYRTEINGMKHEITEKEVQNAINMVLNKLPKLSEDIKESIYHVWKTADKKESRKEDQKKRGETLSLTKEISHLEKCIDEIELSDDLSIDQKVNYIKGYKNRIADITRQIANIKQEDLVFLDKIIRVFDYKYLLKSSSHYDQRDVYIMFVEKILFTTQRDQSGKKVKNDITIILHKRVPYFLTCKETYSF